MHANYLLSRAVVGLAVAAGLNIASPHLRAAAAKTDAFPTYESYIKLSGQAPLISGNQSAFRRRTQKQADGSAGVEDLHLSKELNKSTTMTIDGRALTGAEDYLLHVNVTKDAIGSVDVGYSRFRTFYDGIGGFFPLNGRWLPLKDQDLHTDRSRFWAEAKIALKDKPVFTLRYTNETRTGQKDSTIWGDSNLTGLPMVPANNATRKIAPSAIDMNERHQAVEASLKHTIDRTTAEVKLVGDWINNFDKRTVARYPLEVLPNPERIVYQRDGLISSSFLALATTQTEFSERLGVGTGVSFQHLNSHVRGDRANALGVLPTYDFRDLVGGSKYDVFTANGSVGFKPTTNWVTQLALRYEENYTKSAGTFTRVAQTNATAPQVFTYFKENQRIMERILTPDLSARYVGFKKVVLYGAFSDRLTDGDERRTDQYSTLNPTSSQIWMQEVTQDQAHSTLGANWNVSNALIFRAEAFHKEHENKFLGYENKLGSRYVVGYEFTGFKLSAIVKPIPELSFTTRYLPQHGTMQVTTESTAQFDSMNARSHIIGETIDWNPSAQVYVQVNVNVGFNYISSAYPSAANPLQRNADNNYASGNAIAGWAVAKKTDATIEYTWQKADNFLPALSTYTQPYGASYNEQTVALGVKHKLSDKVIISGKVGYFDSKNDTTGGRTNFRGPLAYVAMEYAL